MNTEFGKWLKNYRISIGIRLYDMATRLGLSSAFISSIESGRKSIPLDFIDKFKYAFNLSPEQLESLDNAVKTTREEELKKKQNIQIKVSTSDNAVQELVYAFARKANELTEEDKEKMWDILRKGN